MAIPIRLPSASRMKACTDAAAPVVQALIDDGALPPLVELVRTAAAQLTERISHLPSRGGWPQKNQEKKNP